MITILIVVAWLTNGTPLPNYFILPEGHPCNQEVARDYTLKFVVPALTDAQIQSPEETLLWQCLVVPVGPGPGPAMRHIPTPDEA